MSAERVAYINSQTAAMLARLEAMKAANRERDRHGFALAYGEDAFNKLADEFGLGCNSVMAYLHQE